MKKHNFLKRSQKKDPIVSKVSFKSGFSLILDHDEILKIEKNSGKHIFGIAIDMGTTSICVSLCNLENQQQLAQATGENAQCEFGLDLVSRYKFGLKSQENLNLLSQKGLMSINQVLDECIGKSGVNRQRIFIAFIVGTPIMHNLLFAIPLGDLRKQSHEANQELMSYSVKAGELGLAINRQACVRFLPQVDNVIGSDVLATILSLGLYKRKKMCLCIDLGMQAKIMLGSSKGVAVTCVGTDSVFEGQLLKCGMVTKAGAIEWVRIDKGKIKLLTIGHIRPRGICGSGIIDIVSELLKEKIIDKNGKMKKRSFVIYQDKKRKIELTAGDLQKIQASKTAVIKALGILLKKLKVAPENIDKVFLAGELGGYLNSEHIIKIGLIPPRFKGKISFVGNAAFLGAKLALLSRGEFYKMLKLAQEVEHVRLQDDKSYYTALKKRSKPSSSGKTS